MKTPSLENCIQTLEGACATAIPGGFKVSTAGRQRRSHDAFPGGDHCNHLGRDA